jgi:hypothetical protein
MRVLKTFAFLALAKLISGCGLADISSGEFKDQKSNWIVPIVNSQISVESISQLADLKFEREVSYTDLPSSLKNLQGPYPEVKLTDNKTVGPLDLTDYDNYYVKAKSDTAVLRAIIYNNFPFDIAAGTVIEIKNRLALPGDSGYSPDTNIAKLGRKKLIYQKTLTRAIKAGQVDSLDIKEDKLLGWIDNDFQIYLKNFSTPGTSSLAGYDITNPLKIVFKLIVLKIKQLNYLEVGTIIRLKCISVRMLFA